MTIKSTSLTEEKIEQATDIAIKRGGEAPLRLLSSDVYKRVKEAIENGAVPPVSGFYSDLDARYWLQNLEGKI
jgi:hypothetical protein